VGPRWLGRAGDVPLTLEVQVFLPTLRPGGEPVVARTTHYDDDGDSQAYLAGAGQWTDVSASATDREVVVRVHAARGTYQGAPSRRSYALRLHMSVPPEEVAVNGDVVAPVPAHTLRDKPGANTWHYDAAGVAVVVSLYVARLWRLPSLRPPPSCPLPITPPCLRPPSSCPP
jgi:hypothetical protein